MRGRNVRTATQNAWLELYFLDHAEALIHESRPLFSDLAEITLSLYSVGRKNQQDVLRAELELSRLDDRLIDIERRRARARAELAEWIGVEANRPIASNFPRWTMLPPKSELEQGLSEHPAVLAAQAQIGASEAEVSIADERSKPDWALDIGYGYREGNLPNGDPRSDFVTVGVTVGFAVFQQEIGGQHVDGSIARSQRCAIVEATAGTRASTTIGCGVRRVAGAHIDGLHSTTPRY